MKIEEYRKDHLEGCLEVFESNASIYFAPNERESFSSFLAVEALSENYFVVLIDGEVVGCGGYEISGGKAGLTWGMVGRAYHGKKIGSFLLSYRLHAIKTSDPSISVYIDTSQHTSGFYSKFGFECIRKTQNGYVLGLHRIDMVLPPKPTNYITATYRGVKVV